MIISKSVVFFSYFQFDFRSFRSTTNLLTVLSDWIFWGFNNSGFIWVVVPDISKHFDWALLGGLLHKPNFQGFSGQVSNIITLDFQKLFAYARSEWSFSRWLWVVLDGESLQKCPADDGVFQDSMCGLIFFYYTLMVFQMMLSVIFRSVLIIPSSTLNFIERFLATTRVGFWTWIWPATL